MLESRHVRRIIELALDEDIGRGDLTSELCVPDGLPCEASIVAKQPFVVCGLPLVSLVFAEARWPLTITEELPEGTAVEAGAVLVQFEAQGRHILTLERTILNFLQRLSGVATATRSVVDACPGVTILDTRKTTPGWRALEKYAVRIGGGRSHRAALDELILIKNNHIDLNGGDVSAALKRARAGKPAFTPIEVEVRSMEELRQVLIEPPEIIMLDNMSDEAIVAAIASIREHAPQTAVEVSGRMNEMRAALLQQYGVAFVSMGSITHSATAVDVSLRVKAVKRARER